MGAYRHIVLFRIHAGCEDQVADALEELRALGFEPGVRDWRVEVSDDTRKGPVLAETGLFDDRLAYDAFCVSDAHRASGQRMSAISDWVIGDYPEA